MGIRKKKDKKNVQPVPHILTDKNKKDEPKCVGDACFAKGKGGGKVKKDGFTQQLNPARINAMSDDEDDHSPSVNYASTLETAYDNLDKLLSSDAISKMSEDTHRLAEKQQVLMGNINKLQPMMQKAGSLLEGLKMPDMEGVMNKLQKGLDKTLGGGVKNAPSKKE